MEKGILAKYAGPSRKIEIGTADLQILFIPSHAVHYALNWLTKPCR
jgi:hypothetical protein